MQFCSLDSLRHLQVQLPPTGITFSRLTAECVDQALVRGFIIATSPQSFGFLIAQKWRQLQKAISFLLAVAVNFFLVNLQPSARDLFLPYNDGEDPSENRKEPETMVAAAPANAVELTLQSVHGVVWKPDKYSAEENLIKRVKACVAFSGSAPNMQVSSFTMCPKTGNLVVGSNCLEAGVEPAAAGQASDSQRTMSARFDDPLEASQAKQRPSLSSSHSASSGASGSSCRPHLQFELSDDSSEVKATPDKYNGGIIPSNSSGDRSIELQISLRSDDPEASSIRHEGVAVLNVPAKFENLPITLDLPIASRPEDAVAATEDSSTGSLVENKSGMLNFDSSAYIRVVLCLAAHRLQQGLSQDQSSSQPELVLSDNLDMLQLGGMMKKMHEKEEIEDARMRAATLIKASNHDANEHKRRNSAFFCNGSSGIGGCVQTFFEILKGCGGQSRNLKTKDLNQDLFLNATMASTIDTRDSLEI